MTVFAGCRVLLVEDESLVAMLAEDMLLELGCEVILAMRLEQAMSYVGSETFDLAILDVNLGRTHSYPIADALVACGTPFLFATGYGTVGLQGRYSAAPVVQKPYHARDLRESMLRLIRETRDERDTPGAAGSRYA